MVAMVLTRYAVNTTPTKSDCSLLMRSAPCSRCRHFTVEFLVGERLEHLKKSHLALEADELIPAEVMLNIYGKQREHQVRPVPLELSSYRVIPFDAEGRKEEGGAGTCVSCGCR